MKRAGVVAEAYWRGWDHYRQCECRRVEPELVLMNWTNPQQQEKKKRRGRKRRNVHHPLVCTQTDFERVLVMLDHHFHDHLRCC
jgi:hypothetical protein